MKNLTRLTFLDRNGRRTPPNVRINTTLLPRDTFKGSKPVLEAYDKYTATIDARQHNYREARKLRDEANAATAAYKSAIRAALTAGEPTDKITNPHDELIARAEAHEGLAREADTHLITLGIYLGEAIATAATSLFPAAEKQMEDAAGRVRADISTLRESWAHWSGAWQVRRILSNAHYYGGGLNNYDPVTALPSEVANAIDVIEEHLTNLDKLRNDEEELTQWRITQDKADKVNAAAWSR